jgi:hypothetical protein
MNMQELGIICVLLAAMPDLASCESSLSQDYQFEKKVKRAQECRQLQDKLVGERPLTPERREEIANTMNGCASFVAAHESEIGMTRRRANSAA